MKQNWKVFYKRRATMKKNPFKSYYCENKGHKTAKCRNWNKCMKNFTQSNTSNTFPGNFLIDEKDQHEIFGTWDIDCGLSFPMRSKLVY